MILVKGKPRYLTLPKLLESSLKLWLHRNTQSFVQRNRLNRLFREFFSAANVKRILITCRHQVGSSPNVNERGFKKYFIKSINNLYIMYPRKRSSISATPSLLYRPPCYCFTYFIYEYLLYTCIYILMQKCYFLEFLIH